MSSASPTSSGPAIEVRGLEKSYGKQLVLDGIDLVVEPGTVFGYIGPNGAGKTTTVKILLGIQWEYRGDVRVAGLDVRKDFREVKRRVGYVPESAALYDGLTAHEHLLLFGRLRGMDDDLVEERAHELLGVLDLESRLHSPVGSFSKGMRQKLLIVAALLHDPEILFLDEPLSGLDVDSTIFLKELLRELADRGRTIFYCSHMMDVVERVCDRIVILHDGRVAADGSFEELSTGAHDASLEDVFHRLTGGAGASERVERFLAALGDPLGPA
jgi:ABC-2 type transport system ATP-binding protein